MILFEDKEYRPFMILLAENEPVLGLDARVHAEILAEWLAKAKVAAVRAATRDRAAARAGVQNEALVVKKIEAGENADPVLSPEGVGDGRTVTLDEVAAAPAELVEEDEVLRLGGLPGGYGAVAVLADAVIGVASAWGEAAEDLCRGIPLFVRRAKKNRGRRR